DRIGRCGGPASKPDRRAGRAAGRRPAPAEKVLSGTFLAPAADDPSAEPSGRMAQTRSLHADCADVSFPDPPSQGSNPPREARGAACGSRGAREAASAAEAGSFGIWPLAPRYFRAQTLYWKPSTTKSCPVMKHGSE